MSMPSTYAIGPWPQPLPACLQHSGSCSPASPAAEPSPCGRSEGRGPRPCSAQAWKVLRAPGWMVLCTDWRSSGYNGIRVEMFSKMDVIGLQIVLRLGKSPFYVSSFILFFYEWDRERVKLTQWSLPWRPWHCRTRTPASWGVRLSGWPAQL